MLAYTHARNCAHAQLRTRPAPSTLLLITHTLRTLYARTPTRTSSAVRLLTAAVTDWLRAVQPLAEPSASQASFLAATNDEKKLKRGSPSEADRPVINHTACASSLRWCACLQPSVVWILQACGEAGHSAKKARTENPTPSNDAGQLSIYRMWSPPVRPIWFRPYRLYNSPSGKGSTSRSLCCTVLAGLYDWRDDSRSAAHACHARCAAPDRPVVHPLRPFGLVWGCSHAFPLPGGHRHAAASKRIGPAHDCCCGTPSRPRVPSAPLPPVYRADSAHTRLPHCALCQGAPHSEACHRLRCAGVQETGARKSLFTNSSAQRP